MTRWKEGFIEHAAPTDPNTYPFILIGNKVDREAERKVKSTDARAWCKENGDMPYFECSAKENISVEEAFIEMAKMAIKRESSNQIFSLPDSIGGAGGAIKLNKNDDQRRTKT